MLFQRKSKTPPSFIKKPMFDSRTVFVCDLYNLAHIPPVTSEVLAAKGVTNISKALYSVSISLLKNAIYQLYQVPAVRKYFGDEFVHGISVQYDSVNKAIMFVNLDDTEETTHYTKELAYLLMKALEPFLRDKNFYIFYQGDSLQFISAEELKRLKNAKVQEYIVWVE